MLFLLALMTKELRARARAAIYKVMGRSNIGGMYLHEFGRLVALVVAVPGIIGVPADSGVVCMVHLSQLLTACWRHAVSTATPEERQCAAASLKLTASLLATLYACLKPHDPETKSAGVLSLYLHSALAHVRDTVGKAFPTTKNVCDDNIEGKISDLNKYSTTRTKNVSRGESLVNKEAVQPTLFNASMARSAVEMMIYTEQITVRTCALGLGPDVRPDLAAAVAFADGDPVLGVESDLAAAAGGAPAAVFSLPGILVDKPKPVRPDESVYAPSSELVLRESLRTSQQTLSLCKCGLLSGMQPSAVGVKATSLHLDGVAEDSDVDDIAAAAAPTAGSSADAGPVAQAAPEGYDGLEQLVADWRRLPRLPKMQTRTALAVVFCTVWTAPTQIRMKSARTSTSPLAIHVQTKRAHPL